MKLWISYSVSQSLLSLILRTSIIIFISKKMMSEACLSAWLQDFADVFNEKKTAILTDHSQVKHAINLKSDIQSSYKSIYNLSEVKLKILHEYLKTSLEKN